MQAGRLRFAFRLRCEIADMHLEMGHFADAEYLYKTLRAYFQEGGWTDIVHRMDVKLALCQYKLQHHAESVLSFFWFFSLFVGLCVSPDAPLPLQVRLFLF